MRITKVDVLAFHRVLFLDHGKILEEGPAKQVLTTPQHARTQEFLRRVLRPI